jgi:O-antigen ligase
MRVLNNTLLYVIFATLGAYALENARVGPPEYAVPYTVPLTGVLCLVVAARLCLRRRALPWVPILAIGSYIASIVISVVCVATPDTALSFKYMAFALGALVIGIGASEQQTIRKCIWWLLISSLLVFAYGIYGYVTGAVGDPIEHTFHYFGVTYQNSTRNGDQLYFLAPFAILFAWHNFPKAGGSTAARMAVLLGLGALALGILLSLSRGAWLALVMAPVMLLWSIRRKRFYPRNWFVKAGAILFILVSIGAAAYWMRNGAEMVVERARTLATMDTEGGNSNANRILVAKQAVATITRNWLGVGVGNARRYLEFADGSPANHAEDAYLQVALEQGLLGILGYGAMVGWIFFTLQRRLRQGTAVWPDWVLFTINVQFIIVGLFNNLNDNMWYWTILGLGIAQCDMKPRRQYHESKSK